MNRLAIFRAISDERDRQEWQQRQGKFLATLAATLPYGGRPALSFSQKHTVMARQLGSVAQTALALEGVVPYPERIDELRVELVQMAALAVAWLESLPDEHDEGVAVA